MNPDMNPEKKLENLKTRLYRIMKSYNPDRLNLHFDLPVRADLHLFEELFSIGHEAWGIIKTNQSWENSFYLFYDYFLLTSSASIKILNSNNQKLFTNDVIVKLVLLIADISQMTTTPGFGGDITKRNHEALGNLLLAFYNLNNLRSIMISKARETGNQEVINFVQRTIECVKQVEKESGES